MFGIGPTNRLDDATQTREKEYWINFTEHYEKLCLSLDYNETNSYAFVNGVEIIRFKAKDSEIKASPLCLGNVSKDFSVDNMNSTEFPGCVYDFSVDYDGAAGDDILDIHNCFMKRNSI